MGNANGKPVVFTDEGAFPSPLHCTQDPEIMVFSSLNLLLARESKNIENDRS